MGSSRSPCASLSSRRRRRRPRAKPWRRGGGGTPRSPFSTAGAALLQVVMLLGSAGLGAQSGAARRARSGVGWRGSGGGWARTWCGDVRCHGPRGMVVLGPAASWWCSGSSWCCGSGGWRGAAAPGVRGWLWPALGSPDLAASLRREAVWWSGRAWARHTVWQRWAKALPRASSRGRRRRRTRVPRSS